MRVRNNDDVIIKSINDKIKIIINLIGMCDNGNICFEFVENDNYKVKTLFKYFTWLSDIPLFCDNSMLNINKLTIKKWLTNINVPLYNVRGDSDKILNKVKEVLQ